MSRQEIMRVSWYKEDEQLHFLRILMEWNYTDQPEQASN